MFTYTFHVTWHKDARVYIATCTAFPAMTTRDTDADGALAKLCRYVANMIEERAVRPVGGGIA